MYLYVFICIYMYLMPCKTVCQYAMPLSEYLLPSKCKTSEYLLVWKNLSEYIYISEYVSVKPNINICQMEWMECQNAK